MKVLKLNSESKKELLAELIKRSPEQMQGFESDVKEILKNVKENKDEALFYYTKKFDKFELNEENIKVTEKEIEEAYAKIDPALLDVIRKAKENIRDFHEKQKLNSWFTTTDKGTFLGQKITPMERAGVYVPGGKAVYPSSVLMNIIPAKTAGVREIIMTTPCNAEGKVDPAVLVAAKEAGCKAIFKVGGAQAIGALAYGTDIIPKVDKIVGPGNIFVALAKKAVFGNVSIDSIAGPSEILVIADETANPRYIAADLLSQAEHDQMASPILITTSEEIATKVQEEIQGFVERLPRTEIITASLENYGYIFIANDINEAVDTANEIASEHLEISAVRLLS